jgi:hypothetical protein
MGGGRGRTADELTAIRDYAMGRSDPLGGARPYWWWWWGVRCLAGDVLRGFEPGLLAGAAHDPAGEGEGET